MANTTKLDRMKDDLNRLKNGLNDALKNDREVEVSQRALIPIYMYIMLEKGGEATDQEIGEKMIDYMPLLPDVRYSKSEVSNGTSTVDKARSFFRTQLEEMGKEIQVELITKDNDRLILTDDGKQIVTKLNLTVEKIISLQKSLLRNSSGHSCGTEILIKRKK
jgi:hypothetical protein